MKHHVYATIALLIGGIVHAMELDRPPAGQEMQMHYHPYAHFNLREPQCSCCGISIWTQKEGEVVRRCDDKQCDGNPECKQKEVPPDSPELLVLAIDEKGYFLATDMATAREHKYGILMGKDRKPIVTFDPENFDPNAYEIKVKKSKHIDVVDPVKMGCGGGTLLTGMIFYVFYPEAFFTTARYAVPASITGLLSFVVGRHIGKNEGVALGFRKGYHMGMQHQEKPEQSEYSDDEDLTLRKRNPFHVENDDAE